MAASSLCGFLSFLLPSQLQSPKKPPTQLISPYPSLSSDSLPTLSSSSSSSVWPQARRNRDEVAPLKVVKNEGSSSTVYLSVVCPSLVHANILFFRSAYNVQVIVDDNEPEEKLLGRFRREVMKAGVIQECKRRRFHENKQDEKKRKTREAAKRNKKRRPWSRIPPRDKQEVSKGKKDDDVEDNWELLEGGLPY